MRHTTRNARRWLWLVVALVGVVPRPAAAERSSSYLAALESISADELRAHVTYLADDQLKGREPGTLGGRAAAEYLARRFAELGLQGAGIDGTYYQPFRPNYRNVLAILLGSDPELRSEIVVVGAHYDHVGRGNRSTSRGGIGRIHNGADDNASGTSALLELAEALTLLPMAPKRSILLVAFDAEELGLLGSKHWTKYPTVPLARVAAMVNLDMIGRLRDERLTVFGSRTGAGLRRLVSRQNDLSGLKLDFSWTFKAHADHYSFFEKDIPVLMMHTGLHDDYHTPRDDAHLIDSGGMSRVTQLLFGVVYDLADRSERPAFRRVAIQEDEDARKRFETTTNSPERLGVRFVYERALTDGVLVRRVIAGSPASQAGIEPGDRILEFAGQTIGGAPKFLAAVRTAENPVELLVRRPGEDEPLRLRAELRGRPMRLGVRLRADPAEPGTVLLVQVLPGSPAAESGLKVGDRIYQIAGRDFADVPEFLRLARGTSDPIEMLVERDGGLRSVILYMEREAPPPPIDG